MLDLLGMANKYGFQSLESAISEYLKLSLSLKNVCVVFDMASAYGLEKLRKQCLAYMDTHASEVMKTEAFLNITKVRLGHRAVYRERIGSAFFKSFLWRRSI